MELILIAAEEKQEEFGHGAEIDLILLRIYFGTLIKAGIQKN